MKLNLLNGDCLDILKTIDSDSIDSIVTDPPYGLSKTPDMFEVIKRWLEGDDYFHRGNGFMGKAWDSFVPGPVIWKECLRVLKPGGHLLSFFGSRTYDLGVTAIRLAGFDIRDQIMWIYGSGFPKSLDVSKSIDKLAGAQRKVIGQEYNFGVTKSSDGKLAFGDYAGSWDLSLPATDEAIKWDGWGTGLKPAHEPICMARKPFTGNLVDNVLKHDTGAININACRVEPANDNVSGRWPANLCHDGSYDVLSLFPQTKSSNKRSAEGRDKVVKGTTWLMNNHQSCEYDDSGSAARYFYCPKASKSDRNEGVTSAYVSNAEMTGRKENSAGLASPRAGAGRKSGGLNFHPTVKPTDLMSWLCKLVTPENGTILDPFMGSGSTGKAAVINNFNFVGIEIDKDYFEIAQQRINFKNDCCKEG